MDRREALKPGTELCFADNSNKATYTIVKEIGRGGSCIVYEAFYHANNGDHKAARIKEFYPIKSHIRRINELELETDETYKKAFLSGKERFEKAFHEQNSIFKITGLTNSISNTIDVYSCNNTIYITSVFSEGNTLEKYKPDSIFDAVTVVISIANAIRKIHEAGYLYLDTKPDNVYVFPETWELIQLFDFDSLVPIDACADIQRLSYSRGFAAVEQQRGDYIHLGPWTDVFGLGAVLYWLIQGKIPTAFECDGSAVYSFNGGLFEGRSFRDRLYKELTLFFHKTLASYYADRYQDIKSATQHLYRIRTLADESEEYVYSSILPHQRTFVGRTSELKKIDELLSEQGNPFIIVKGLGGIGKSSLVKQYINSHEGKFDAVIYLDYRGSIKDCILSDQMIKMNNTHKIQEENNKEYYTRKVNKLREVASDQKLFVVLDNFYTNAGEDLSEFLNIGWSGIIVTRERDIPLDYPVLSVDSIDQISELKQFFENYSGLRLDSEGIQNLIKISHMINGHTLTLQLFAKQIYSGSMSFKQVMEFASSHRFDQTTEQLSQTKDNRFYQGKIHELLSELLNVDRLSTQERAVMKIVSAFSAPGIKKEDYKNFTEDTVEDRFTMLIQKGWIEYELERLYIHPVLQEIVRTWTWTQEYIVSERRMMTNLANEISMEYKAYGKFRDSDKDRMIECLELARQIVDWYPNKDREMTLLQYNIIRVIPQSEEEEILQRAGDMLENGVKLRSEEKIQLHYEMAYIYDQQNNAERALKEIRKADRYVLLSRNPLTKAEHLFWQAMELEQMGQYDKAIRLLHKSEKAVIKVGDIEALTKYAFYLTRDVHWQLENIYDHPLNESDVIQKLDQVAKIIKELELDDMDIISSFFYNRALLGCRLGEDPEEIWSDVETGIKIIAKMVTSDYFFIDNITFLLWQIYEELGDPEGCITVLKDGVMLCEKYPDSIPYIRKKLQLWLDLAWSYHELEDYSEEQRFLDKIKNALEENPDLNMSKGFIRAYNQACS